MAIQACHLIPFLSLALFGSAFWHLKPESFSRRSFPADFVFGTATSAYQVEGAAGEGGRGPSVWDTFTKEHPDKIMDRSNGTVALDSYHRFKGDVRIMKEMGVDAYRFSISWPRILPSLETYVTLFHWDVPQTLEDEYGGFLSPHIVDDFKNYANLCFSLFGDRVKSWITLNEPWTFCRMGYSLGKYAPGRCSPWEEGKCSTGDSGREPYIAAHHQLLAHAAAVKLYRDEYQASQKGKIGIALFSEWFLPYSNTKTDNDAAVRAIDFKFGWFMDPLTQGDYPFNMRALVQDRLPQFTAEQSEMIKGSFDFLGVNYYTSYYAKSVSWPRNVNISYENDRQVFTPGVRQGIPIGPMAASDWLFIYPPGLRELLLYIKDKYSNPVIYITENGVDEPNNATLGLENALKDDTRIQYYRQHLESVQMAVRQGVNVKGYFAWSLFDNFEWSDGYTVRFGLYYVDYMSLERYPKSSALWFRRFLKK